MSFVSILEKYRKLSFSERDKGDRFERLMQAYLQTDPRYAYLLKKVWLWKDFPYRADFGGKDTGIDLVAITVDGDYWAIQCKCYSEDAIIDKPAVDTFLSTSSREFKDENLRTVRFSHRLWISTTNKWGPNATEAIKNQNPPVSRFNLYELTEAPVDWEKLDEGIFGEQSQAPKKQLYLHQKEALEKAHEYFLTADRGKLIMACGTGKTFASLRIAENETNNQGTILFMVPSIALLGQILREWYADAIEPINAICICSDPGVSRKKTNNPDTDTYSIVDLALPASTNTSAIIRQFQNIKRQNKSGMTVVFSTYQSIDVIAETQRRLLREGFGEFDLIICDEAHRTTGVTLADEDETAFVKVHDNDFIKAKKRIYMTATPRLYSDDSKSKAAEADAVLCSMDDPRLYGEEIYRIGFGEAVERDLLTDYKVLILTLNDKNVPPVIQDMIADQDSEIKADDATKLVGCISALSKQLIGDEGVTQRADPEPMRRAVAFCQSIKVSKKITNIYNDVAETYLNTLPEDRKEKMVRVESQHMDGTMSAPVREEMLSWLKAPIDGNECRIITNVRVLSEGVDVPSLDAVLFLSPRNSQVDVVQSVGRVMRKSPGKKYGYIVIPVVVPSDVEADKALDDNERYKVVWTVLNALRAHDDRFNATVNKIDLNKKKPEQILVGLPRVSFDDGGTPVEESSEGAGGVTKGIGAQMALKFAELQEVVYAKLVQKVGDRRYWEQWAKDIAYIADRQIERVTYLVSHRPQEKEAFQNFLLGLQKNINPSIDQSQAIEMLAQHIITKPIFEALFDDYSFVLNNPVSTSMQKMLDALSGESIAEESATLQRFYQSVKKRAEGIDNAEGKQRIIVELYDKFFKTAFPKMVEQLGIVYTPVEIVDFIIQSVDVVLRSEFGRTLSDENIHILDPFTGTGTFITRLLQSGLINNKDLTRKYRHEIHANEIVLLAYYIAAVNIENAYHDLLGEQGTYEAFDGIVLTDTFQLGESDEDERLFSELFSQNSQRVIDQKKSPIRVIVGNPPYSVGQRSANDNAQNLKYERLDNRIASTYAKESSAGLNKSLYDSYIRAFRWSTDRVDSSHGGIIAFVSNVGWLDGNSTDGFRKELEKEFSSIWVFNLRGNQRTKGELSRREGGKIFGSGSRTPIAITFLVKNPAVKTHKATIYYHDIGDYLSRSEKLVLIKKFGSLSNQNLDWTILRPNEQGDWISQRSKKFDALIPLQPEKKFFSNSKSFFNTYAIGVSTNRDAWIYNFCSSNLKKNIKSLIEYYNIQRDSYIRRSLLDPNMKVEDIVDATPTRIAWTRSLRRDAKNNLTHAYEDGSLAVGLYRPYCKQKMYFNKSLIEAIGLSPKMLPSTTTDNLIICVSGIGVTKEFSTIITDSIPDLELIGKSQCFPLYYYEKQEKSTPTLFDQLGASEYIRKDGLSDFILDRAKKQYGKNVTKEDIFYYVYGILHSPQYRKTFRNDLSKMLPRLPLLDDVRDFWKFSKSGRQLADLHINYESVSPYPDVIIEGEESGFFTVEKMRFSKKDVIVKGKKVKVIDKSQIVYNSRITISNIPDKAYEYIVNGQSAIEWIMERYQDKVDSASGIRNNPNDLAEEVGNPRYILDLLLSIINVSVQTVDIINSLPDMKFE